MGKVIACITFLNNGKNTNNKQIRWCCYMKMTKEEAEILAKKILLNSKKYGLPSTPKKGKPLKKD